MTEISPTTTRTRQRLLLAAKFIVTPLCFYALTRAIDWGDVAAVVRDIRLPWVALAIAIFWLAQVAAALRCSYIANALGSKLSLSSALRALFIGLWFNQVLPTGLGGDVVKIAVLQKTLGLNRSLRCVVLERFSGLTFLLLVIAVLLPLYATFLSGLPNLALQLAVLSGIYFGGIALSVWGMRRVPAAARPIPVLRELMQILVDIDSFRSAANLWRQLWTSSVVHFTSIASFALLGVAIGLDVDVLAFILIVPVVLLIMMIPLSFAGWGLREISATWLFGAAGIANEQALALSICFGLLLVIAGLPGLVLFYRNS